MTSIDEKISRLSPEYSKAIHELYLEGIDVTEDMVDEISLLDSNEISEEEFVKRAVEKSLSKNE